MINSALLNEYTKILEKSARDWRVFARRVLDAGLDKEQEAILQSVQFNRMTSVVSGTARGKDYVGAVAAMCFLYLTPKWNEEGEMIENTKVCCTGPTERQIANIIMPEISRLYQKMVSNGFGYLAGRLTQNEIKTENREWFLTGFKADEHSPESWSGLHASNIMFVVTEASGVPETIFNQIEGNLQGNSRLLLVFNDNTGTGYASNSQKSSRFHHFRLDDLQAPNVIQRKIVVPGQVDFDWVNDKVKNWCTIIGENEFSEAEGDFYWTDENGMKACYRPNDLFRVKVRGLAPKVSSDILIPIDWVEQANKRWREMQNDHITDAQGHQGSTAKVTMATKSLRLGVDVAGMGRDSSCFCYRYGSYVQRFELIQSGGQANHMQVVGTVLNAMKGNTYSVRDNYSEHPVSSSFYAQAFIDTIGEGAGVYSRLLEIAVEKVIKKEYVHSVKNSEVAEWHGLPLKDKTGVYEFLNMRAYLYWSIRDWLNPANKTGAALPPDDLLMQELTETKWEFLSNGKIKIEPKDEIKKRIKRSPDKSDALANTFYPAEDYDPSSRRKPINYAQFFQ